MKVTFEDYEESGWQICLEAETVKDAAMLARFGLNAKKEAPKITVTAISSRIACEMWFERRKDWTATIKRGA